MKEHESIIDVEHEGECIKDDLRSVLMGYHLTLKYLYRDIKKATDPEFKMRLVNKIQQVTKRRDIMRSLIWTFHDLIDHAVEKDESSSC